jgi:Peptidase family M28
MSAADTAAGLASFAGRGPGTDAERRAAHWLARQVRSRRRDVRLETFWCRPNWALAHAWHCLLAVIGSLLTVHHATVGGALVLVALLSVLADGFTGRSLGRRLTPERASQNVLSPAPVRRPVGGPAGPPPVRLIVTANYDAGRIGLAYRDAIRRPVAALKRLAADGALTPGWLGWLSIELLWLLGVATLRAGDASGTPVGVLQLVPTAALVVELALLLDLAAAPYGPAAGDNAGGAAVALALVRALDAAPPRNLAVELVLQGAADGSMIGLRRHLRARRRELSPRDTIVLGVGPCGAGQPCWWVSDGSLVPLRYLARLRALAARLASGEGGRAAPHRGRGTSPALPARARGLPALTLGAVDRRGLAPRSHQRGDTPEAMEPGTLDAVLQFALLLVDALDAELGRTASDRSDAAPAAA